MKRSEKQFTDGRDVPNHRCTIAMLGFLKTDLACYDCRLSAAEWAAVAEKAASVHFPARSVIYDHKLVGDRWLLLCSGVAASRQTHESGRWSIARFFEAGQFCGNLTSTWEQTPAADDLLAISEVVGIEFPHGMFKAEYLEGGAFGRYLRLKVVETLCFDKDIVTTKTFSDSEMRYQFLNERYGQVVSTALHIDLAAFMGMTPQGFSRFLRNRAKS
ncbi:MAG: hypothetical protein AAF865_16670 [Pseudomonadota bacterium]